VPLSRGWSAGVRRRSGRCPEASEDTNGDSDQAPCCRDGGAATVTVGGAVTASAAPTSPTAASSEGKKSEGNDAAVAKVAASLHVSVKQLATALRNLKQAVGKGTAEKVAVAAFAKELGISVAQAEKALNPVVG
jgi:hypothetical protein